MCICLHVTEFVHKILILNTKIFQSTPPSVETFHFLFYTLSEKHLQKLDCPTLSSNSGQSGTCISWIFEETSKTNYMISVRMSSYCGEVINATPLTGIRTPLWSKFRKIQLEYHRINEEEIEWLTLPRSMREQSERSMDNAADRGNVRWPRLGWQSTSCESSPTQQQPQLNPSTVQLGGSRQAYRITMWLTEFKKLNWFHWLQH